MGDVTSLTKKSILDKEPFKLQNSHMFKEVTQIYIEFIINNKRRKNSVEYLCEGWIGISLVNQPNEIPE